MAADPGLARACFLNAAFCDAEAGWDDGDTPAADDDPTVAATTPDEPPLTALIAPRLLDALAPWPDTVPTVLYESGLQASARYRPEAAASLQRFLEAAPKTDPRHSLAAAALAEISLLESPPDLNRARQWLKAAHKAGPNAETRERLEWLDLWIEEKDAAFATALEKARAFLIDWPESPRRPLVRLRCAAWLGRLGEWPAAVAEYTALADELETAGESDDVATPFAARAAYLAGLAELRVPSPGSLDHAIDHWREAAALDDSMVFPARFQQALAKSRLGQNDEALLQLEALLTGPPALTPAQRTAALLAQGELYLRPGASAPAQPEKACEAFTQVATDRAAPPAQRAQALCRHGDALRALNRHDEAFRLYQDAARPLLGGRPPSNPRAALWPARAGLAAVALLEEKKDWRAAAELAQQLAATPGPHASLARDKAARLRLEHFLWEGD